MMKNFAGSMIFCGVTFVLLLVLTASNDESILRDTDPRHPFALLIAATANAHAHTYFICKWEPVKPITGLAFNAGNPPQKNVPSLLQQSYQAQQCPTVIPVTPVMSMPNLQKPAPIAMINRHSIDLVTHGPPIVCVLSRNSRTFFVEW